MNLSFSIKKFLNNLLKNKNFITQGGNTTKDDRTG